ncbi:hypothetical protein M514_05023 [Trichuris suis]|uniref:Uncharacterized protein n=1 Tax=Trichuris suis TaxID=68888 RepID=A0A085NCX5_9BILA|nr:hypothetical protein M514_05023 [Trichuris suis]
MGTSSKQLVVELEKLFVLAKHVSELCALDPALENVQRTAVELFEKCAEKVYKICNDTVQEGPVSTGFGENEEGASDVHSHSAPVLTPTQMEFRPALGEFAVPRAKGKMASSRDTYDPTLQSAAVLDRPLSSGDIDITKGSAVAMMRDGNSLPYLVEPEEEVVPRKNVTAKQRKQDDPNIGVLISLEPESIPVAIENATDDGLQALGLCQSGHILELKELFGDGSCLLSAEETENSHISSLE